ncbi:MAG: protocatechuate 3,4-dioxygenase subunit beta [Microbacteriaceae bacterium]
MPTQDDISAEISAIRANPLPRDPNWAPHRPDTGFDPYRSSLLRHPTKALELADPETIELTSPAFGPRDVGEAESDLTTMSTGEPLGERMVVEGCLLDGDGRPVRNQLIEVWQANAAGRYRHKRDRHPAPLDPHFTGAGRMLTDDEGRYRFTTIKPGAYPWRNHENAWRPAHIHFSVFGEAFTQRLVTQMYFPGDPLMPLDPIFQSIPDQRARDGLIAAYDHELTSPEWALGYRWDIVLTGSRRTWIEPEEGDE